MISNATFSTDAKYKITRFLRSALLQLDMLKKSKQLFDEVKDECYRVLQARIDSFASPNFITDLTSDAPVQITDEKTTFNLLHCFQFFCSTFLDDTYHKTIVDIEKVIAEAEHASISLDCESVSSAAVCDTIPKNSLIIMRDAATFTAVIDELRVFVSCYFSDGKTLTVDEALDKYVYSKLFTIWKVPSCAIKHLRLRCENSSDFERLRDYRLESSSDIADLSAKLRSLEAYAACCSKTCGFSKILDSLPSNATGPARRDSLLLNASVVCRNSFINIPTGPRDSLNASVVCRKSFINIPTGPRDSLMIKKSSTSSPTFPWNASAVCCQSHVDIPTGPAATRDIPLTMKKASTSSQLILSDNSFSASQQFQKNNNLHEYCISSCHGSIQERLDRFCVQTNVLLFIVQFCTVMMHPQDLESVVVKVIWNTRSFVEHMKFMRVAMRVAVLAQEKQVLPTIIKFMKQATVNEIKSHADLSALISRSDGSQELLTAWANTLQEHQRAASSYELLKTEYLWGSYDSVAAFFQQDSSISHSIIFSLRLKSHYCFDCFSDFCTRRALRDELKRRESACFEERKNQRELDELRQQQMREQQERRQQEELRQKEQKRKEALIRYREKARERARLKRLEALAAKQASSESSATTVATTIADSCECATNKRKRDTCN